MSQTQDITPIQAIKNAKQAMRAGEKRLARQWAAYAASLDPNRVEPWLLLAALAKPRASLEYVRRALQIDPNSKLAQRGLEWAVGRIQSKGTINPEHKLQLQTAAAGTHRAWLSFPLIAALMVIAVGLIAWGPVPDVSAMINLPTAAQPVVAASRGNPLTPTPTATFTPTPTPTATPKPTRTPTKTPKPTRTPAPAKPSSSAPISTDVGPNEHWVEIDLSEQKLFAYRGDKLLKTYSVSTGLPNTPTVVGIFQVYVKLESQNMSGYGYYLPNVPWVMYFYKDYAIHGTYWHNNFGQPMSHGCVNMKTPEAEWMYAFADYGTLVIVHY